MELIVSACLAVIFNVMDSVSTYIGMHKIPENLRGREGNPVMAKLMKVSPILAEVVKHGIVGVLVGLSVVQKDVIALKLMAVLLGLVVTNNTYMIIVRLIMKKKVASPIFYLIKLFRIPKPLHYVFAVLILVSIGVGIVRLLG